MNINELQATETWVGLRNRNRHQWYLLVTVTDSGLL